MLSLLKSVLSISVLKTLDYIVPIVIMPLVLNRFEIDGYGIYSYILTISAFLAFLSDICLTSIGVQQFNKYKSEGNNEQSFVISLVLMKNLSLLFLLLLLYIASGFINLPNMEYVALFSVGFSIINIWYYISKDNFKFIILTSVLIKGVGLLICFLYAFELDEFVLIQAITILSVGLLSFAKIIIENSNGRFNATICKEYFVNIKDIYTYSSINAFVQPFVNSTILASGDTILLGIYNVVMRFVNASVNFSSAIIAVINRSNSEIHFSNQTDSVEYKKQIIKLLALSLFVFLCVSIASNLLLVTTNNVLEKGSILWVCLISFAVVPSIMNQHLTQLIHLLKSSERVKFFVVFSNALSILIIYTLSEQLPYYYVVISVVLCPMIITFLCLKELK